MTTIKGVQENRQLVMGCPQGGVLSVLIWSLVFDELLNKFSKGKLKCVGYADDGCLLIEGTNLNHMYRQMNTAIKKAELWANSCGLSISPEKTVAVLFTNKTKYTLPPLPLITGGKALKLSKSTLE